MCKSWSRPAVNVADTARHISEMHHLDPAALSAFWAEVRITSRAISDLFSPVKLDHLSMGHRCPHLHCHIYPQYENNDPFQNIDISVGNGRPQLEELTHRASMIAGHIEEFVAQNSEPGRFPVQGEGPGEGNVLPRVPRPSLAGPDQD